MRTLSASQTAVYSAAGGVTRRVRVQVKDSGGTWRNLTTYGGVDFVLGASWNEGIDTNGHDCTITLKRANEKLSLAPLMEGSPLNLAFAYPGSYAPLIDIGREVKVEWAIDPAGSTPTYVIGFHGYIDTINPAQSGGVININARGQYALPLDAFIEEERVYAHANPLDADATKGCLIFQTGFTYAVGQLVIPSEAKRNGHFYAVDTITTGSATSEGTWPTGGGATVTMGGVTFKEKGVTTTVTGTDVETVLQQLLNDNMSSPPTVNVPASPSWKIRWYKQSRQSAWTAIRALVDQIGWDLRYKWHSGSSDYRLEFYEVPRSKTTPDFTFTPDKRFAVRRLETKLEGIRNVVRVIYLDSQDTDEQGNPRRKMVTVSDSGSITRYGRRFMEASEGKTSNIDSSSEATTFANGMLSDLKDPVAELEVEMPFFPYVELGDLYRFTADGFNFDSDQDLAVVSYSHKIDQKSAATTIVCRGKPSGGYARWLRQDAGRTVSVHQLQLNQLAETSMAWSSVVGGTKLSLEGIVSKATFPSANEFHVSDTASFTPSPATLVAATHAADAVVPDLIPGKTYYAKFVPFGRNDSKIVRGLPSEEISFVAGQASAGHIVAGIDFSEGPLNGGFETRLDAAGMPDHWTVYAGTYSTDVEIKEDSSGISGGRYARIKTTSGGIRAAVFPIINEADETNRYGSLYRFTWWVKNGSSNSAGSQYDAIFRLLNSAGSEINTIVTVMAADNKKGHWTRQELYFDIKPSDPTCRAAQLQFKGRSGATLVVDLDVCRMQYLGTDWYLVDSTTKYTDNYESLPAFANSWVNYGGSYSKAAFRRDQFGRIWLKGLVKSGTVGATIFTLPVGFRPSEHLQFVGTDGANVPQRIEIQTGGTVVLAAGNNGFVSLDSINFMTY